MARKTISLLLLVLLLLSTMTTAFAAEGDADVHDGQTEEIQESAVLSNEGDTASPTDLPPGQEPPAYTVLMTHLGVGLGVLGTVEDSGPGIVPFIVGSRPCLFLNCPNSVTVTSKYSFVCNQHKCSVAGCPWVYWQSSPKLCQVHAGITNLTCQASMDDGSLCGLPSVGNGSPCCWYHHCPGCYGLGNDNGTLCDLCRQCWVPGCLNLSTCTNECDLHCPHTCKTHQYWLGAGAAHRVYL